MSSLKRKDPFIGYVHNLSSPRKGRKCTWFDMELQGPDNKRVRAVCFAKDKRTTLLEKQNTLSPVKISNYILGPSWTGEGQEIRINDMSIIQAPSANEYNFQYIPGENAASELEITELRAVLTDVESGTVVNVKGKIKKGENVEVVGKNNLKMQKSVICDKSGALQITFWEDEIDQIKDGVVYKILNVSVRNRDRIKSLTTTRNSVFMEVEDLDLNKIDENAAYESLNKSALETVLEVETIRSVEVDKYKSCVQCSAKFPPGIETSVVKCLRCGHRMLLNTCQQVVACHFTVLSEETVITLTCFSEVLENLFEEADVYTMSEDYIAERLLVLQNMQFSFNDENVITNISQL